MSWDLALVCDHCDHALFEQNYTHNTNPMMNEAHSRDGHWLDLIDGAPGPDGAQLLADIVTEFDTRPAWYRSMNPVNGWGDMDQLAALLRKMVRQVPESQTTWVVTSR